VCVCIINQNDKELDDILLSSVRAAQILTRTIIIIDAYLA